MAYAGITKKAMKNGSVNIFVSFKYLSKRYPIKNFTKLFGCKTEKQAYEKLQEIKLEISKGRDPFVVIKETLNELYDDRVETKLKNGAWRQQTADNYNYFYNRYVRDSIGYKKISKITYDDLRNLYDKGMNHVEDSTKNQFKMIVRPIFTEELKKGNIHTNVIDLLETYNMPVREKIELRTNEKDIEIVRKIYNAISKYKALKKEQKEEIQAFFYLILLTAHRHGELRRLRIEHCYIEEGFFLAPKTITKTKEDYKYPIPHEVIPYLKKIKSGLIIPTIKRGSIYQMFQRLLEEAGIKSFENKSLSPHDSRRLMLTIMIRDLKIDSVLADSCLSHKQTGTIKHYLSFTYKDIEESYNKYWNYIRMSLA